MKKQIEKILTAAVWSIMVLSILSVACIYVFKFFVTDAAGEKWTELKQNSQIESVKVAYQLNGMGGYVKVQNIIDKSSGINMTAGAMGNGVNITAQRKNVENAVITFNYDKSLIDDQDAEHLGIAYYDEKAGRMQLLDARADVDNATVSVETNHFSEYIVVDTDEWYDAWLESQLMIRDMNNPEYFDIAFVLDNSGSMDGEKNELSCKCTYDFICELYDSDIFSLITFNNDAQILLRSQEYSTVNKEELRGVIDSIGSGGGTNINEALKAGVDVLNQVQNIDKSRIMVLLSDGQSGVDENYIEMANDCSIKIITVGFGNDADESILQDIATKTGGRYYKASENNVSDIFERIREEYLGIDLSKDSDSDSIPDRIERMGMRNQYGRIITTDPYNADTDGDSRKDGEEMGTLVTDENVTESDKARGLTRYVYFRMNSDPTIYDGLNADNSDGEFREGTFPITYRSDIANKDVTRDFYYTDDFFTQESSEYNNDLAIVSLGMAAAGFSTRNSDKYWLSDNPYIDSQMTVRREDNILKAYDTLGFAKSRFYNYESNLNDTSDKTAFSFAHKTVEDENGDENTLVAVVVRGGGYGCEWSSNFNVGDLPYHEGFSEASWEVLKTLTKYINELYDYDKIKGKLRFWITGYSRGAAVANATATRLVKIYGSDNIYAYCFATPQWVNIEQDTIYNDIDCSCIHNILNPGDVVPTVALSQWGFGRMGNDTAISNLLPTNWDVNINTNTVGNVINGDGANNVTNTVPDISSPQNLDAEYVKTKVVSIFQRITGENSETNAALTPANGDLPGIINNKLYNMASSTQEFNDKYQSFVWDVLRVMMSKYYSANDPDRELSVWEKTVLLYPSFTSERSKNMERIAEENGISNDGNALNAVEELAHLHNIELDGDALGLIISAALNLKDLSGAHHPDVYMTWLECYKEIYE